MFYTIRHQTKFRYSAAVSESLMELRMQPRTEGPQRCLSFQLSITPKTRVHLYRDYLGNIVHHFDVPGQHRQLSILAEALVDVRPPLDAPECLEQGAWADLDAAIAGGDFWEMLTPSVFARPSAAFDQFVRELGFESRADARRRDPLELLRTISAALYANIAYSPKTTQVDSPIDHALQERKGVCQDFAHIMITLVRQMGVPCRYVSGYLFHRLGEKTRSAEGATHAWVEAYLPQLGWLGIDPTNNVFVSDRHIRTAVGRDYADVPPSRGLFKGSAESELSVTVRVAPSDAPPPNEEDKVGGGEDWSTIVQEDGHELVGATQQQQQQQQ
jgi:transglutaminase-like putative cysteine protease